jgi:hypothetical protein
VRRTGSQATGAGRVVARTDSLTLERDGSNGGWRLVNTPGAGQNTAVFTGITSAGTTVNKVLTFPVPVAAGTNTVFSNADDILWFQGSFGNAYGGGNITEVSLMRYTGDFWWFGTLRSTFNQ